MTPEIPKTTNEVSNTFARWKEHVRLRPEMYIGTPGDGSLASDGLYRLIREAMDSAIGKFVIGSMPIIEVSIIDQRLSIRDYHEVLYPEWLSEYVSERNGVAIGSYKTAFDILSYGIGLKTVNLLSASFKATSIGEGITQIAEFEQGRLICESREEGNTLPAGNLISFVPDVAIFGHFHFVSEYVEQILWSYVYLNKGLEIKFDGRSFQASNGLPDLLERHFGFDKKSYPIIHLEDRDFDCVFSHYKENIFYQGDYYCFVNGQNTTEGDQYLNTFREAIVNTLREYYRKDFEPTDVLDCFVAAISLKNTRPKYEYEYDSTKLFSQKLYNGKTLSGFVKRNLDNYLQINPVIARALERKILQSEKERNKRESINKAVRKINKN